MILTAARVRETLDARWDEINLDAATFTIPASRMKMNVAHVIALSTGALDVLAKQQAVRQNDWILPGRFGSPRGSSSIAPALARINVGYTLHGWRSVARDAMPTCWRLTGRRANLYWRTSPRASKALTDARPALPRGP
jgi:integrase